MTHSVTKAVLPAVLSAAVAITALAAENTQYENGIMPRIGKFALDRTGMSNKLIPNLKVVDGNLVDRLGRYGFMFIIK
ncbi:MAG: hypothetical protein J6P13_05055 [Kiritimatiellae bacterium]|nr:hypothetical protein [Kiritimatiellia bacterium]